MKFNLCCDMNLSQIVKDSHAKIVDSMSTPYWMDRIDCPFCKTLMPRTNIRGITFKMNPSHIGDLCVEFLCEQCCHGDYLYIREAAKNINDMRDILSGSKDIGTKLFMIEEENRKLLYNNSLERAMGEKKATIISFEKG